jgi:hypothetical protein
VRGRFTQAGRTAAIAARPRTLGCGRFVFVLPILVG